MESQIQIINKPKTRYTIAELLNSNLEEPTWVIDGLVLENGITVLGGSPGSLKSYLALTMGIGVASGTHIIGRKTKQLPVLYLDFENGTAIMLIRTKKLLAGYNLDVNPCLTFEFSSDINLEEIVKDTGAKLVIIDSLVRITRGDEDKSSTMNVIHHQLKSISKKYGISWLLLHHERKSQQGFDKKNDIDDLRGSGDLGAFSDSILMVRKIDTDVYQLKQVKNRTGALSKQIELKVNDVNNRLTIDNVKEFLPQIKVNLPISAANEIHSWLDKEAITSFRTANVKKQFSKYKNNTVSSALAHLNSTNRIKMIGHGRYEKVI